MARRGSREPCGSKSFTSTPCGHRNRVEARESLVDRSLVDGTCDRREHESRLARALWIEVAVRCKFHHCCKCRGSREPCGSKSQSHFHSYTCSAVEARESLVDRSDASNNALKPAEAVEARESLVDRSCFMLFRVQHVHCRGSREPCGSKSFHICVFSICNLSRLARALWIEVPYYDNLPRVERSRLARALWIEVTVSGALCRKRCRGSREPCGSKSNQFNPHNNVSRRGSREPCGSKFPSFSNDVHPPVEARESLVDRRVQRSPLLYFFHSRGSREPCGSKDLSGVRRCQCMYRSRLARALWIEGL